MVKGFKFAALDARLRKEDRPDLGLIFCPAATAAGVFTTSRVKAAPVLISKKHLSSGRASAILVNSGQANASTGSEGLEDALTTARALAQALDIKPEAVLLASTGVIGDRLPVDKITASAAALADRLSPEAMESVARAMLTTDTGPKTAVSQGQAAGAPFTVAGMAKGAGMIAPNMATMLAFVMTDLAVDSAYLQDALSLVNERTFNSITVDGDTSTNDTVFLLASGAAGNEPLAGPQDPGAAEFESALEDVMGRLARAIVADGEGATKLVKILVEHAASDAEARTAALTVANSLLVKTAFFGQDPNWGRFMMAIGKSGVQFDPMRVDIRLDNLLLVQDSRFKGPEAEAARVMRQPEFTVGIDLKAGEGRASVLTCDLGHEYVKINADYRS